MATSQVLNCLSADSRGAVDDMIGKAHGAGGGADDNDAERWWHAQSRLCPSYIHLIADPQPQPAVERVTDRLRAGGTVEEEVGDPALGDAEAEPAAIFEPALVADRWREQPTPLPIANKRIANSEPK